MSPEIKEDSDCFLTVSFHILLIRLWAQKKLLKLVLDFFGQHECQFWHTVQLAESIYHISIRGAAVKILGPANGLLLNMFKRCEKKLETSRKYSKLYQFGKIYIFFKKNSKTCICHLDHCNEKTISVSQLWVSKGKL